jgi:hypothetical protein
MIRPDTGSADERRLLRAFRGLGRADRDTLLAFAEFLAARGDDDASRRGPPVPLEPVPEPRPAQETAIAAIKRLRRVYPMLDGSKMLNETSALMGAHVLQGRDAAEVIDELETLFEARWIEHRDAAV